MDSPKYDVEVQLSGKDGNAGAIMGRVADALRQAPRVRAGTPLTGRQGYQPRRKP